MASSNKPSATDSAALQTRLAVGGFALSVAGVGLAALSFLASFVVTPLWHHFHTQPAVTVDNAMSSYSRVTGDLRRAGWESDAATIVNHTDHTIAVLWGHVWQQPSPFQGEPDDSILTELRPQRGKPFDGQHPVLVRAGRGLSVYADRFWLSGVPPLPARWKHSEGKVSFEVVTDDGRSWVKRVSAHRLAYPYQPTYPKRNHSIGIRCIVVLLGITMLLVGLALRRAGARRPRTPAATE